MDAANPSATPTFASRTPLHIGAIGLIARDLDRLTNYYRDLLGLTVLERRRHACPARRRGVTLIEIEHRPDAKPDDPAEAGLYHTAFLMPTRQDHARWIMHIAQEPHPDLRRIRPRRQRSVLSRRSRRQRHRGLQRSPTQALELGEWSGHDADQATRHRGDPAGDRSGIRHLSGRAAMAYGSATSTFASAISRRRSNSIAVRSVST